MRSASAITYTCDRCGRRSETLIGSVILYDPDRTAEIVAIAKDLCPQYYDQFKAWLRNDPPREK